jgi:hypothetical protein
MSLLWILCADCRTRRCLCLYFFDSLELGNCLCNLAGSYKPYRSELIAQISAVNVSYLPVGREEKNRLPLAACFNILHVTGYASFSTCM